MTFKKNKLLGCSQVKPNSFLSPSSFRSLASILMVGSVMAFPGFAQAQVSVYQHCNYDGYEVEMHEGNYDLESFKNIHDDLKGNEISSVKVDQGYKVTLYGNKDYSGRKLTITDHVPCLTTHNFNDIMSSMRVERVPSGEFTTQAKNIRTVELPGDGESLAQVSVGKVKAWVWTKSSGDQVLYYENTRSASAINLQDANTRESAKIDLSRKRFTAAGGHDVAISGTNDRPEGFRDMYVIEVKNKIIAAYYADGNFVYGGPEAKPECSFGVEGGYKELFQPACEVHDRYYNAPWELILYEKWKYDFDGRDSADGNSALVKDIVESSFRDDMDDICNDTETSAQLLSLGFCHTTKFTWYNSLRDSGSFYENQERVSRSTHWTKNNGMSVVYRMPKTEMISWLENANKSVEIRGDGTTFEVEIDCNVTGANNESTGDAISVEFFNEFNRPIGKTVSNGVGSCIADKSFTVSVTEPPSYFNVSTNGEDGYMIDELVVRKNGKQIGRKGIDNDKGWCLSTDPTDADGEWKNHVAGKCQTTHRFDMGETNTKLPYEVRIDCLVSGADDEETSNRITVRWYSVDGRDLGAIYRDGIDTCHGANQTWKIELEQPASYVTVSTNGDNGYLMDQVQLYANGTKVKEHGENDSRGWCLSTDNTDHNKGNFNGHSVDSKCPPVRKFTY